MGSFAPFLQRSVQGLQPRRLSTEQLLKSQAQLCSLDRQSQRLMYKVHDYVSLKCSINHSDLISIWLIRPDKMNKNGSKYFRAYPEWSST